MTARVVAIITAVIVTAKIINVLHDYAVTRTIVKDSTGPEAAQ